VTPAQIQYLVLKAQAGDSKSMALLCEYMYPKLIRYGSKVCADHELGKEATQDVLLKVSLSLYSVRDPGAFTRWCFRLMRNRCLDLLNSSYHRRTQLLADEQGTPTCAQHESAAQGKQVFSYLAMLTPEDRDTVYFFYVEELSVQDISHITSVPEGTVKSRLFRARKQLKARLEKTEMINN